MKNIIILKDTLQSYILVFFIGITAGVFCRLTDLFPSNTFWGFSSIATLYGFWVFSITMLVYFSSSNKTAGLNAFIYMFGMTISFYLLKYILGYYIPRFNSGSFQTHLFFVYSILAVICGIGGYILYFWASSSKCSSILYALPISALSAESIGVTIYFFTNKEYFFQLLFDLLCAVFLGGLFYKKAANKFSYCLTMVIVTPVIYILVYKPFLNI